VSELIHQSSTGNCEWRTCPRSLCAFGVGFKPTTLWTQGTELTTGSPRPTCMSVVTVQHANYLAIGTLINLLE